MRLFRQVGIKQHLQCRVVAVDEVETIPILLASLSSNPREAVDRRRIGRLLHVGFFVMATVPVAAALIWGVAIAQGYFAWK